MELREAVVVEALRTPFGKYGGALRSVRPDDLAAHVIGALVERTGIDSNSIDDVFWGAANGAGEDNRNVARMAGLMAGLPVAVPGVTINRLCGSGLQAVVSAAREIQVGAAELVIAGGAEGMTRAPMVMLKSESAFERGNQTVYDTTLGWRMVNPRMEAMYPPISLGETAENVARKYDVSREDQDALALQSHTRAVAAQDSCAFSQEIAPIEVPAAKNERVTLSADEGPRRDTSTERLSRLRPAFDEGGSVTAGNSSPLSDGAAVVLLASRDAAARLGLRPMARFLDAATAGVHPDYMGLGPIPATRKLLMRLDLRTDDLDVIEINEAFASQVLACVRELGIDAERINRRGGAIAIGHPLGASGARLVATLVHQLKAGDARFGLATMCIGVGQGISAVFERAAG
ncbi:MAG TPA: thiolase family protein [Chloroflexota bacterium]